MAKGDPDPEVFHGLEAGEVICTYRGWVKDCQISNEGDVTLKHGVYLPDKYDALKMTDIRGRVMVVEVRYLRRPKTADRTHLDKLRAMEEGPSLADEIDQGDVIDLGLFRDLNGFVPRVFVMSTDG
jgi:hypothetical protein